jgi:hypothetical protein
MWLGGLDLTLNIYRQGGRYQVAVSPPEGRTWRSSEPLTAYEVFEKLSSLGCHSTDISDALYAADPVWSTRYDAEVVRRRAEREDRPEG